MEYIFVLRLLLGRFFFFFFFVWGHSQNGVEHLSGEFRRQGNQRIGHDHTLREVRWGRGRAAAAGTIRYKFHPVIFLFFLSKSLCGTTLDCPACAGCQLEQVGYDFAPPSCPRCWQRFDSTGLVSTSC